MSQIFESLRMSVETENESSHNKIESRDWEWDESFPWESQFRDRDESLAEVWHITCLQHWKGTYYLGNALIRKVVLENLRTINYNEPWTGFSFNGRAFFGILSS